MMAAFIFPLLASAHVKLRYSYQNKGPAIPIRNAPGPYADGIFSTAGPCGGDLPWGGNGYANMTDDGRSLTLKISYNGGHQSSENNFRMAFLCVPVGQGIPEQDLTRSQSTLIAGCQSVPSTEGTIDPPYPVTCNLPKQNLTGTQVKDCTVSVLDQRNWGGCNDIRLSAMPAPPANPPAAFILPSKIVGYQISRNIQTAKVDQVCNEFMGSSLQVKALTTTTKGVKQQTILVTGHLCMKTGVCWENEVILKKPDGKNPVTFTGTTTIHGESYQVDYVNNNPNPNLLTLTNTAPKNPTICDGIFLDIDHCDGCTTIPCSCSGSNAPVSKRGVASSVVIVVLVVAAMITVYVLMLLKKLVVTKITTPGILKIVSVSMRATQLVLCLINFSVAGHWAITMAGLDDTSLRWMVAVSVLGFLSVIPWLAVDIMKTWGPDTYNKIIKTDVCRAKVEFGFDLFWAVVLMVAVSAISTFPGVGVDNAQFLGSLTALWFVWFAFLVSQFLSTTFLFFAQDWTSEGKSDEEVDNPDMGTPQKETQIDVDESDYGSTAL